MQISPDMASFLSLLMLAVGARRALELGTFTGYSALAIASALPADGVLVACDTSDEWTSIAREYWAAAGVEERIELRLGPALRTLDSLLRDGEAGSFDFAFIDADKAEYDDYYERVLALLRAGGLMVLDNMFWDGAVLEETPPDRETAVLKALNVKMRDDERVDAVLLTVRDGIMLARKR